jgi:hypothetical protein
MPATRRATKKQTNITSKLAKRTQDGGNSDDSSDLEPFPQEYLDGLLEKAKIAASNEQAAATSQGREEEIILLGQEEEDL